MFFPNKVFVTFLFAILSLLSLETLFLFENNQNENYSETKFLRSQTDSFLKSRVLETDFFFQSRSLETEESAQTESTTTEGKAEESSTEEQSESVKESAKESEGESEKTGEINVFKLGTNIDVAAGCLTFLLLVSATIIIEGITSLLNRLLRGSEHWLAIVEKVYRELMILGLISFILNATRVSGALWWVKETWMIAFEFSHNLLFLVGLSFALLSITICLIVVGAEKRFDNYEKAELQKMVICVRKSSSWFSRFWMSFTTMGNAIDFLLLKHIFITGRKLPQNFRFQKYVQKVMLESVSEVVDVEMSSWAIVGVATCAGLAEYYKHFKEREPYQGPATYQSVKDFIIVGFGMALIEIVLFLSIRSAVSRVVDHEGFGGRISIEKAVEKLKQVKINSGIQHQTSIGSDSLNSISSAQLAEQPLVDIDQIKRLTSHDSGEAEKEKGHQTHHHKEHHHSSKEHKKHDDSSKEDQLGKPSRALKSVAVAMLHLPFDKKKASAVRPERKQAEFIELELSYAYPLRSPKIFKKINDAFLLLKCLYLALFFNYFSSAALDQAPTNFGRGLLIVMVLPLLFTSVWITPMVFTYEAILSSVAHVQPEVLGEVLEEMLNQTDEMKDKVSQQLRDALGNNQDKEKIRELFQSIDVDGSGTLSAKELQKGLAQLGLFYSAHQFSSMFRVFNPKGGDMHYEQFVEFVYPLRAKSVVGDYTLKTTPSGSVQVTPVQDTAVALSQELSDLTARLAKESNSAHDNKTTAQAKRLAGELLKFVEEVENKKNRHTTPIMIVPDLSHQQNAQIQPSDSLTSLSLNDTDREGRPL